MYDIEDGELSLTTSQDINRQRWMSLSGVITTGHHAVSGYGTRRRSVTSRGALESNDFLAMLTCANHLYSQPGVLKMRVQDANDTVAGRQHRVLVGKGGMGQVRRVDADFAQPSALHSTQVDSTVIECAAKRYSKELWDQNGEPLDRLQTRQFITELRVLSHPDVRSSDYIVRILGLEWNIEEDSIPKPIIILEKAETDLSEFLRQFPALPVATKLRLSQDIASGISLLHNCGIVHGDLKPENILIFNTHGSYRAKVADFSHSVFDKKAGKQRLPGGTAKYAAPEWRDWMTFDDLKRADMYSFGLVFACVLMGRDIFTPADLAELNSRKQDDTLLGHLRQQISSLRDPNLDNEPLLYDILGFTVQKARESRDLGQVLERLQKGELPNPSPKQPSTLLTDPFECPELAIPYHALSETSLSPVRRHIVQVLDHMGGREDDARSPAATFELAVCYGSSFGVQHKSVINDDKMQAKSTEKLLLAAQQGDPRAILALIPVHKGFGRELPPDIPIQQWLRGLVEESGSRVALSQLKELNPSLHDELLHQYRRTYCGSSYVMFHNEFARLDVDTKQDLAGPVNDRGDTVIHYASATGDGELLENLRARGLSTQLLNQQNVDGDTALIHATRAGHAALVRSLVAMGADASIRNRYHETALHFLPNLDDGDVDEIANLLVFDGGARSQIQSYARRPSYYSLSSLPLTGPGTAVFRAVYCNNPVVLRELFGIEDLLVAAGDGQALLTGTSALLRLTVLALKLCHSQTLEVLGSRLGLSQLHHSTNDPVFHHDGHFRTLIETCIYGPVSSTATLGFNMPEPFTRIARFGGEDKSVLFSCINYLSNGGENEAFRDGIVHFAIEHQRRDAIRVLSNLPSVWSGDQLLSWASLVLKLRPGNWHEIIHDLLQRHRLFVQLNGHEGPSVKSTFPMLCIKLAFKLGMDPVLLGIFLSWLNRTFPQGVNIGWALSSASFDGQEQVRQEGEQTLFALGLDHVHPIISALQAGRDDLIHLLFRFGSSLQDEAGVLPLPHENPESHNPPSRQTVFNYLLSYHHPTTTARLIQAALLHNPEEVVRFLDIATILLGQSQHPSQGGADNQYVYFKTKNDGLLAWHNTSRTSPMSHSDGRMAEQAASEELWASVAAAVKQQQRNVDCPMRDNLLLHAALRSNLPAVRILLDLGVHPNASGKFRFYHSYDDDGGGDKSMFLSGSLAEYWVVIQMTPLDAVSWTSTIPDEWLSEQGRQRKWRNQEIADMLVACGATHSESYTSRGFHLVTLSWREIAGLVLSVASVSRQNDGLLMWLAGFVSINGLFLPAAWGIWKGNAEVEGYFPEWVAYFFLGQAIVLSGAMLYALFWHICPVWFAFDGPRRRALIQVAYGGDRWVYWRVVVGRWANAFAWVQVITTAMSRSIRWFFFLMRRMNLTTTPAQEGERRPLLPGVPREGYASNDREGSEERGGARRC